jgi:hypothetical protein
MLNKSAPSYFEMFLKMEIKNVAEEVMIERNFAP